MGLTVVLQDERGRREGDAVEDAQGLLNSLLPPVEDEAFRYLPYIDRYGDTIFNSLQMEPFLREWRLLNGRASNADEQALVDHVAQLAVRCQDADHIYLRFIGD